MQFKEWLAAIRGFLFYEEAQERRQPEVDWAPVRQAQLALLLQKYDLKSSIASMAVTMGAWGVMFALSRSLWSPAWAALVLALQLWHYVQTTKATRQIRKGAGPLFITAALHQQTLFMWAIGGAWGLAPWVMSANNEVAFLSLIIFLFGLSASAAVVLSPHAQVVMAFLLPSMSSLIVHSMYFGGFLGWLMAPYVLIFLLFNIHWSFAQARQLEKSLRTGIENEKLAARLQQQTVQLHEQVERAHASEQEKTRFVASASHDLRQPLHAATLFAAALSHSSTLGSHDRTLAQHVSESLAVLSVSLNGMLDLSQLDAGTIIPDIQPVNLQETLLALHNTYVLAAEQKGLELRIRSAGSLWVLSDGVLLERLLGNLIDNAIKHTSKGGVLVLARYPAKTPESVLATMRIDIIDTGPGIDSAQHERIFDEFYQINNPQRDRNRGFGLGLAIVKRLVVLLGHHLTLRSRLGHGCRLTLWLTQAQAPLLTTAAPANATAAVNNGELPYHALILDDDQAGVQALSSLLKSYGMRVSTAYDVEQAWALMREPATTGAKGPVGMVISDFRLPGAQSGLDFLLELRRTHPGLPTLMITGETAPERIAIIRQHGVSCLFKPVETGELFACLVRLVREGRAAASSSSM